VTSSSTGNRSWLPILLIGLSVPTALGVWNGEISDHPWLNHDVSNALYVGSRVFDGEILYLDWKYYVLPAVVFLSEAAWGLARLSSLSPITMTNLIVVAFAALGGATLARAFPARGNGALVAVLAQLGVLVYAGDPADFGQREQLFALLFVPYFIWRSSAARLSPVVCLLLFGLGYIAMIKPHFVVAVALTELAYLRASPSRHAIWGLLLAGAAVSPLLLLLQGREPFLALWTRVLPYHTSRMDSFLNQSWFPFLSSARHLAVLGLGAALLGALWFARRRGLIGRRAAIATAAVAVWLHASFLQQRKFFSYHEIPFIAFAYTHLLVLAWGLAQRLAPTLLRRLGSAAVLVVALGVFGWGSIQLAAQFDAGPSAPFQSIEPFLEHKKLVLVFSFSVEGELFTHAILHGMELMGPWTSHYALPGLLADEDRERRRLALRAYFAPIAEAIEARRPDLVLFLPGWLGSRTLHDVFVRDAGMFPIAGYRFLARTRYGWMIYAPPDAGT